MLTRLLNVLGFRIEATDGTLGEVRDFSFDEETWTVRYMVADTRRWLPGKRVLIVPEAFAELNPAVRHFSVNLTRDQVRDSPDHAEDLPVSRQWEAELHGHYGWIPYWEPWPAGGWPTPAVPPPASTTGGYDPQAGERGDPHLRSIREVADYAIAATDGEIGRVTDFVAATDSWRILYLVVETGKWLPGRSFLLPTACIGDVSWSECHVSAHLQRRRIEDSPPFDPVGMITRDYEARLFEHYGRKPYWLA